MGWPTAPTYEQTIAQYRLERAATKMAMENGHPLMARIMLTENEVATLLFCMENTELDALNEDLDSPLEVNSKEWDNLREVLETHFKIFKDE